MFPSFLLRSYVGAREPECNHSFTVIHSTRAGIEPAPKPGIETVFTAVARDPVGRRVGRLDVPRKMVLARPYMNQ